MVHSSERNAMESEIAEVELEEMVKELVDYGCIAIQVNKQFAEEGAVMMDIRFDNGHLGETIEQNPKEYLPSHIVNLLRTETVAFDGVEYSFHPIFGDWGLSPMTHEQIYVSEKMADGEQLEQTSVEEGLNKISSLV